MRTTASLFRLTNVLGMLVLSACAGRAAAAAPAPATSTGTVKASTATFVAPSPATIYTTEKLRDPFSMSAGGARAAASKPFSLEDFNIHNLSLRGMMKDRTADYALFSDSVLAGSFILRKGRLLDPRGKPIPGVKGSMDLKKKTAHLETAEGDVQIFKLGDDATD